jgi:tetrahydrodipicolinate N-succinyltransferase
MSQSPFTSQDTTTPRSTFSRMDTVETVQSDDSDNEDEEVSQIYENIIQEEKDMIKDIDIDKTKEQSLLTAEENLLQEIDRVIEKHKKEENRSKVVKFQAMRDRVSSSIKAHKNKGGTKRRMKRRKYHKKTNRRQKKRTQKRSRGRKGLPARI